MLRATQESYDYLNNSNISSIILAPPQKELPTKAYLNKTKFNKATFCNVNKPLRSPLFYVGDKYKLMAQLKSLFPKDIECYFEPFCGGGSSFLNVKAKHYKLNDIDYNLILLHTLLQNHAHDKKGFFDNLFSLIKSYNLSCSLLGIIPPLELHQSHKKTYFARFNKSAYLKMRADFNADKSDIAKLYLLLIYGFNRFLRFNSKGDFNLPVGNVDFNNNVFNALNHYFDFTQGKDMEFFSCDYKEFLSRFSINEGDFIYFDPPYLISDSEYNKLWNTDKEMEFYAFLDSLDSRGVRFGLTNLLTHKGRHNEMLKRFAQKYHCKDIVSNYISFNDNTIKKDSREIYVSNYKNEIDYIYINAINKTKLQDLIQSPLNYTGSKFRLLPQILPLFPKDISTMVDLFCGGASVGINVSAGHIILNDKIKELVEILSLLKRESIGSLLGQIKRIITDFQLSDSAKFGYKFYKCDSTKGLSSYNKAGFSRLKNAYNSDKDALKLFVLIIYAFNNQIRFNSKGEFNLPCGKRDFNAKMQQKLKNFIQAIQSKNISLENKDFREFDSGILDKQSLVYIDPPYLLANAGYNENGGWSERDEKDLLDFINFLDSRGVRFALSNVLFHKGKEHKILATWLKSNPKFHTHFLDFSYKNCNYQTKRAESSEVLIANFKAEK